jgi:hypothetical protein
MTRTKNERHGPPRVRGLLLYLRAVRSRLAGVQGSGGLCLVQVQVLEQASRTCSEARPTGGEEEAEEEVMSLRTPGPWGLPLQHTATAAQTTVIAERDGCIVEVATTGGMGATLAESEANARLIAAAPELLDALRSCLHGDQGWPGYAQDVIAKIEGR